MRFSSLKVGGLFALGTVEALSLDVNNPDSVKTAAKSVAKGLIASYNGTKPGEIPGIFGLPNYWWSGAVVWDALIDYWYLTGDATYNDVVEQALLFQVGPNQDYMPPNQTKSEGNDDQSTWALAALTALERSFPGGQPPYQTLAQNVFDKQALRWDSMYCGGGLRWQIFSFNSGYNYKNSVSNGQFFELAARLARYTGNTTYSDWASKVYGWTETVGLLDERGNVYDGTDLTINCTQINRIQWTSDAGTFLYGSALMYNTTNGSQTWQNRTNVLLSSIKDIFFASNIVTEVACETNGKCDSDQLFFKGMLLRNLARTAKAAPFTADTILPLLQGSGEAAAITGCASSSDQCSFGWVSGTSNKATGVGPQFSALEAIQVNLAGNGSLSGANSSGTTSGSGTTATSKPNAGVSLVPKMEALGAAALLLAFSIASFA